MGFMKKWKNSPDRINPHRVIRLKTQLPSLFQDMLTDTGMGATDVEFICKGGEIVKAHRVVLSLMSKFFTSLFRKQKPHKPSVVTVPDLDGRTLESLLMLCYKRVVRVSTERELFDIITWLEIFGISRSEVSYTLTSGGQSVDDSGQGSKPDKDPGTDSQQGMEFAASRESGQTRPDSRSSAITFEGGFSTSFLGKTCSTYTPRDNAGETFTASQSVGGSSPKPSTSGWQSIKCDIQEVEVGPPQEMPRYFVRMDGGSQSLVPVPQMTYWMDTDRKHGERSSTTAPTYFPYGYSGLPIAHWAPMTSFVSATKRPKVNLPEHGASSINKERYSPDITDFKESRPHQASGMVLNPHATLKDRPSLMCPFCQSIATNEVTWHDHVSRCGRAPKDVKPGSGLVRLKDESEGTPTLKRRMSSRPTSIPIPLRDDYVPDPSSPADLSVVVNGRPISAALSRKYAKLKKQVKSKTRRLNGMKNILKAQKSYRAAATRLFRTAPRVPEECLKSAEKADEQERIRWLYVCTVCSNSLDSSIKAHAHYLKCSPHLKYEDIIIKYRQGYYGNNLCPLCPRKYTTIYGFVVHCIHNHPDYKKMLSHVISEDKLMCINCGDKFAGPTEFHAHLEGGAACQKPTKQEVTKRKYKKAASRRYLVESPQSVETQTTSASASPEDEPNDEQDASGLNDVAMSNTGSGKSRLQMYDFNESLDEEALS